MENESIYNLNILKFKELFPISDYLSLGNDFCIVHMKYENCLKFINSPCRLDGYMVCFCMKGRVKIGVNTKEYELSENGIFVSVPSNLFTIMEIEESQKDELLFIAVAASRDYMSSLKHDLEKFFTDAVVFLANPCFLIKDDEKELAMEYLKLMRKVANSTLVYKRLSISALVVSMLLLAAAAIEKRGVVDSKGLKDGISRSESIFNDFLRLVADYHSRERSVKFYASELSLTPKYLSKLIKEASGKSAPEWIDSYVLLEAKNYLRHSDYPIKEIASRLNFPSVSSFHRYFKTLNGTTPLDYRKSFLLA